MTVLQKEVLKNSWKSLESLRGRHGKNKHKESKWFSTFPSNLQFPSVWTLLTLTDSGLGTESGELRPNLGTKGEVQHKEEGKPPEWILKFAVCDSVTFSSCGRPRGPHLHWNFPSPLWGGLPSLCPYVYPAFRYQFNCVPFHLFWKRHLVTALTLTPQAVVPASLPSSRPGGLELSGQGPWVNPKG